MVAGEPVLQISKQTTRAFKTNHPGIYLLENLKLDELVGKNVSEFALILQPMKMQGGAGSTVAPVALR